MGREGGAGTAAAGHHRIQLKRTESLSSSSWSWSTKHSEWFHASLYCLSCHVNLNTPRPGPTNLNTKLSVVDKETMQALSLTSFVWWVAFVGFIRGCYEYLNSFSRYQNSWLTSHGLCKWFHLFVMLAFVDVDCWLFITVLQSYDECSRGGA